MIKNAECKNDRNRELTCGKKRKKYEEDRIIFNDTKIQENILKSEHHKNFIEYYLTS